MIMDSDKLILRKMDEDYYLLKAGAGFPVIQPVRLNDTGGEIMKRLLSGMSISDTAIDIAKECGVEDASEQIKNDILALVESMQGIIEYKE